MNMAALAAMFVFGHRYSAAANVGDGDAAGRIAR
jgi:hypothetical protein